MDEEDPKICHVFANLNKFSVMDPKKQRRVILCHTCHIAMIREKSHKKEKITKRENIT